MKVSSTVVFCVLVVISSASSQAPESLKCSSDASIFLSHQPNWITLQKTCEDVMRHQVKTEIEAALTYMRMGAHFSKDTVNRPGFAKMFFESANEEREHAFKIIKYLLMRGKNVADVSNDLKSLFPLNKKTVWFDGLEALNEALVLETTVTEAIDNIIQLCEKSCPKKAGCQDPKNDYHLVDYLTGEFLEEQFKGQRDLAGKVVTLEKMTSAFGGLGEYLFDKKLLNEEIPVLS
ncbi:ferritin heavy chain [Anabrus simplex]|uniref:ferritin heavy chain n=1 Tax=Anabrus simplex TaxID=316456 RepID=UPI0034DCC5C0